MNEKSEQITVAVYMITYNHEHFIRQAVESVMLQKTDFNFRLFIGDDKSSDGTTEICNELAAQFPGKIDLTTNKINLGASKNAINIFKKCFSSGAKYVALLEGDDYWTDLFKLQKQINFLEANASIVCHCHNAEIWQEGGILINYNSMPLPTELSRRDVIKNIAIPTASVTFRNIFKDKIPDYLLQSSMDIIIYFSLASHGNFYMSEEFMSVYRFHTGGWWSGQSEKLKDKKLLDLQHHLLDQLPLDDNERNDVNENIIRIKQKRIKQYANKYHFGFTYFKDVFYLMGAKIKGKNVNLNFLLYLMFPEAITSFFKRASEK